VDAGGSGASDGSTRESAARISGNIDEPTIVNSEQAADLIRWNAQNP
jgi:hypothetical protein